MREQTPNHQAQKDLFPGNKLIFLRPSGIACAVAGSTGEGLHRFFDFSQKGRVYRLLRNLVPRREPNGL
jgi:hypothetical protein